MPCPLPAGPPLDSATLWCPLYTSSCYRYNTTASTFAAHEANCARSGGKLVSYTSYKEQVGGRAALLAHTLGASGSKQ